MEKYDIFPLLKEQQNLNNRMMGKIKEILEEEGRMDILTDKDDPLDFDYPVSTMAYGHDENFELTITSVYMSDGTVYMNGLDPCKTMATGLRVHKEMSYDVLYFINCALNIRS